MATRLTKGQVDLPGLGSTDSPKEKVLELKVFYGLLGFWGCSGVGFRFLVGFMLKAFGEIALT